MSEVTTEKWILNKSMHLGYIKDSFAKGVVIEHFVEEKALLIDGRRFDEVRDLTILKNQSGKSPNDPWILPFSEEAIEVAQATSVPVVRPKPAQNKARQMEIIRCDDDLMGAIDISHTQISRIKKEAADAEVALAKENLEVVRGDESQQDRVRRLQETVPAMPIVKDDSLGESVAGGISLNAGTVKTKTAAEIETLRSEAEQKAGAGEVKRMPIINEDQTDALLGSN